MLFFVFYVYQTANVKNIKQLVQEIRNSQFPENKAMLVMVSTADYTQSAGKKFNPNFRFSKYF